jgi:succinate-semialdehyde dehydrogenase/glutarate-semialdehyde dehydrogenase
MAEEMGKPLDQGRAEVEKCAWLCEFYAESGPGMLARDSVVVEEAQAWVAYRPLGVILGIMPWNFPFWQALRFAAPVVMAGNAIILKHAPNVPGCAGALEGLFRGAGAPEGLFRTLYLDVEQTGALIDDPRIAAVSFTGSTGAGRAVAARAGGALKKVVLELGGSDPYLIFSDADVTAAAEICARARLVNAGQSCVAAKRFLVVPEVREAFEHALVRAMREVRMGPPAEEGVTLGPLARKDLREVLHAQVTGSLARGARLLLGGEIPEGPGWFYPPTVLTDVSEGQPAWDEELFGPVAAVIPVRDEEEALAVAGSTRYGLGAAIFSRDVSRATELAETRVQAGTVFVNDMVRSHPALPFGGIRESGYGRELGLWGIREFVNVKTVWIA